MKIIYYLCMMFLFLSESSAQISVGINTNTPQALLHIDGSANTSGNTNTADDLTVDSKGNTGIGVLTPTAKVHVSKSVSSSTPLFRLDDGTAKPNYVLSSIDDEGTATWKPLPPIGASLTWKVANAAFPISSALVKDFTGTVTTSGGLNGFATKSNSSLFVPKGRYIISIYGDLNGWEWVKLLVVGTTSANPVPSILTSITYRSYLNSSSNFWTISEDTTIKFRVQGYDARNIYWETTAGSSTNSSLDMWYQITFLKVG